MFTGGEVPSLEKTTGEHNSERICTWSPIVMTSGAQTGYDFTIFSGLPGSCRSRKGAEWQKALAFLSLAMQSMPTIITYSATISACEKAGKWREAHESCAQDAMGTREAV